MKRRYKVIILLSLAVIAVGVMIFLEKAYVPPILMYHSIDSHENESKISLSPEKFAMQMEYLSRHKYNVVTLEEMVKLIESKKRMPRKTICITFDDGNENNYLLAYPILKRYNFPAAMFVVTDWVGKKGFMTWDEIKELADSGIITIGSHSKTHMLLPGASLDELRMEIIKSKEILEKHLAMPVHYFCYPAGRHDERVKAVVKEAGYLAAAATNPGRSKRWDDIFALKRIRISRTSDRPLTFWYEINGYYTFIKEVRDEE